MQRPLEPVAAERMVRSLGNRPEHVQAVASKASAIAEVLDPDDRTVLVVAAWLHDVGYAPALRRTGAHQLDGACFIRSCGQERVARLVAHHSEAGFELALRGLERELATFPREESPVADALTWCDMTTDRDGRHVTLDQRLARVAARYGRDHVVTRALRRAEPLLAAAIARSEQLVRARDLRLPVA